MRTGIFLIYLFYNVCLKLNIKFYVTNANIYLDILYFLKSYIACKFIFCVLFIQVFIITLKINK